MKQKAQIIGLIGFILSGLLFALDALIHKNGLVLASCILWIISCVIWLIPEVCEKP